MEHPNKKPPDEGGGDKSSRRFVPKNTRGQANRGRGRKYSAQNHNQPSRSYDNSNYYFNFFKNDMAIFFLKIRYLTMCTFFFF